MSLRNRIGSGLLALLVMSAHAQSREPNLDLNKAVENPSLVRAMDRVASDTSDAAKDQLLAELQRANYLAAMVPDDGKTPFNGPPGVKVLSKGTQFGVLAAGKDGKSYMMLFTDWTALREYTKLKVTGWVLPAREAWAFALQKGFDGAVVNPAHNALPLRRAMLEYLSKQPSK